jgi:hypothetical protein
MDAGQGGIAVKTLHIRWQRLVDAGGKTCDRCGSTGAAVENAVAMLGRSLQELGIDVVLKAEALAPSTFARDPLASNRIWIGGVPLEWWLSASSGKSQCCSACGDTECRTVTIDGRTYEAIPVDLILKAGLLAAARLLHPDPSEKGLENQENLPVGPDGTLPTSQCGCG